MLSINNTTLPKRNSNFLNFRGISRPRIIQNKYSNLTPLTRDTISFRGETATAVLNSALMQAFDNKEVCREIFENAQPATNILNGYLKSILRPYMYSTTNPDGMVQEVVTRVKTPASIREKAADKLDWAIRHNTTKTFNPMDSDAIKENCNDIIGGRIILRDPERSKTKQLIDTLIEEVSAKRLKIIKIENYTSDSLDEQYQYFSREDLERLKKAVNDAYRTNIEVTQNEKNTGYMALHLDVDLSNPEYKSKNDGYVGEIQIVGYDVLKLKEVEDFCYKLKSKKRIKGGHPAYIPFSTYFNKLISNDEQPNLIDDFTLYTKRAYEFQRKKDPVEKRQKKDPELPTIAECNMEGRIPPGLDFNVLAKIKAKCDDVYDIFEKFLK